MGVSIGFRLKAAAIVFIGTVFLLILFTGFHAEKAEARANLTAYLTVPPNSWEPMGYNVTGTPWLAVQTVGWNAVKIMGNASDQAANQTSPLNASFNRPLHDPYLSILIGRPIDDMLYEYPLNPASTLYARLLGLTVPSGGCANIGIRCLGYGY